MSALLVVRHGTGGRGLWRTGEQFRGQLAKAPILKEK